MKLSQEQATKIISSIEIPSVNMMMYLLSIGADPNADNNYAIKWASCCGHLKVVELLLKDKRVDPSDDKNEAIKKAYKNGNSKVVELLKKYYIENGIEPPDMETT